MASRLTQILFCGVVMIGVGRMNAMAQEENTGLGSIIAVRYGDDFSLEAGIGYGEWKNATGHAYSFSVSHGVSASAELILAEKPVLGVRTGLWANHLLALGLSFGYYTDFDQSVYVLQPEIGLGFAPARISWRANLHSAIATPPPGMNANDIALVVTLKF